MPNINIPLNSGIDNFSDGEEVGSNGNLKLENVYISTPGKIIQRPYASELFQLNDIKILKIKRWANPDLPYQGFGWVVSVLNVLLSKKEIRIYDRDFNNYTLVTDVNLNPSKIEILENVALFTMGVQEESLRYKYFNQTFFDEEFLFQGWHLDIGRPRNTFATIKSVSSSGTSTGKLENNKYFFYKIVPIFDGLQISDLPNTYVFAESTVNNDKMILQIQIDLANMNPRCSAIDIYRAEGTTELEEDLNYYKIKSISTLSPLSQTGAINDFSLIGMTIADNGSFYDSGDYSPDDWMCVLQQRFPTADRGVLTSATSDAGVSSIRLWNQVSGTVTYDNTLKNSNKCHTQYASGDSLPFNVPSNGNMPWYDRPTYETQSSYSKDAYPFVGFTHTQSSANDNATDTAILGAKIRQTSHNSSGDKNWIMLKRENKIQNGHFMQGTYNWDRTVQNAQSQNLPSNYYGDTVSWSTNNYKPQGGYPYYHDYERPQMLISSHFGGTWAGQGNAYANNDGTVVNNQMLQTVTLEAGKKYWVQYAYQWCIRNAYGDHQKKQYAYVKLTKPNGAYGNGNNYNFSSKNNNDGVFFHEYGYYSGNTRHSISGNNYTNYEKGWWKHGEVFTAEAGDYSLNFWFHAREDYAFAGFQYQTHLIRIKDVAIYEVDERNNYYAGNKVILPSQFKNQDPVNIANPLISNNDYQGGNVFVEDVKIPITNNTNTIFELAGNIPSNLSGTSSNVLITKGLNTSKTTEEGREKLNLEFNDIGYSSVLKHPTYETPINVKYEFSQYIEGRMFVANCRYTNEQYDEVEQDSNLVLFSNLNQPNVIPITNYIKCQDNQGGSITGLAELMGNLVVFLEDSIWRINIPSTDPQAWSLIESAKELGCTSKSSIMSYEDGVFFANKEGIWGLSQNFMPKELSKLWRDEYQSNYDDHTLIHYCPKSHMLYINQNNPYETWVLDINNDKQSTSWLKLVEKGTGLEMSGYSGFMNDETSKPFFFENRGNDCVIGELEPKKGNHKSGMTKKTGWIRLGSLEKRHMVRRVNIRYKNKYSETGLAPNLNLYIDGKDDVAYTKKGDELFIDKTGEESIASLRCGVRCRYFSLELSSVPSQDIESDINNIFEILSLEIEWE